MKCNCLQAIFIGYGPGIHSKVNVLPFENIEVYNLLCGKFIKYHESLKEFL